MQCCFMWHDHEYRSSAADGARHGIALQHCCKHLTTLGLRPRMQIVPKCCYHGSFICPRHNHKYRGSAAGNVFVLRHCLIALPVSPRHLDKGHDMPDCAKKGSYHGTFGSP
jgi:hypothetical protein